MPKRDVPPAVGHGVRLRLLSRADLGRTLAWRNRDENRRWFLHADPIAMEQHLGWFQGYSGRDDDFVFVVEDLEADGAPVGQVALYRIDWGCREAEFGRLLIGEPTARGKGIGLRATLAVLDLGFGAWGLERIHLEVFAHNERAIRIYRDCGFRTVEGEAEGEVLVMDLTRERWACPTRGRVAS